MYHASVITLLLWKYAQGSSQVVFLNCFRSFGSGVLGTYYSYMVTPHRFHLLQDSISHTCTETPQIYQVDPPMCANCWWVYVCTWLFVFMCVKETSETRREREEGKEREGRRENKREGEKKNERDVPLCYRNLKVTNNCFQWWFNAFMYMFFNSSTLVALGIPAIVVIANVSSGDSKFTVNSFPPFLCTDKDSDFFTSIPLSSITGLIAFYMLFVIGWIVHKVCCMLWELHTHYIHSSIHHHTPIHPSMYPSIHPSIHPSIDIIAGLRTPAMRQGLLELTRMLLLLLLLLLLLWWNREGTCNCARVPEYLRITCVQLESKTFGR